MENRVAAIIPAAGSGTRMGMDTNKLLLEVLGRPVIALTLDAFESCPLVDEIILVANEQDIFSYRDIVADEGYAKVTQIIRGGETRADSVYAGLLAAEDCDIAVIHDGARALVTPELIAEVIEAQAETGAAVAAVPVVDTIKRGANGFITETLQRDGLWQIQTPQVFAYRPLLHAYEEGDFTATDDAAIAERAGMQIKLAKGSYDNIKITTPFDLAVAEATITLRMEWL